jgi:VanZ family protein
LALAVAYAAFLVWATHHPKPGDLLGPNPPPDKLLHFGAYGVLGFLVASTVAASGRWSRRTAVILAVGLAIAAGVDEVTQPMFGRSAEVLDWVFDVIGLFGGIATVAMICRLLGRSRRG